MDPDATIIADTENPSEAEEVVLDEILVEEVSIDGMCGVY